MNIVVTQSESLGRHTTLKAGGVSRYFTRVTNEAELLEALDFAAENSFPFKVLGGGSNVLVSDDGYAGLVIKIANQGIEVNESEDSVMMTVAAGEVFDDVVNFAVERGWWGIENLSLIPGTVGATPVQNVGAYGVEIKDVLESVKVYDTKEKKFLTLSNEDCSFSYRDSLFKQVPGRYIIVSVVLRLSKIANPKISYKDLAARFSDSEPELKDIREAVIEIRSHKFPDWNKVGTAGSFFKNPFITVDKFEEIIKTYPELPKYDVGENMVKIPLGYVFDKILNLKGFKEGNVGTYEGQALVLVNYGGATATEIKSFAEALATQVKAKLGIDIEWEVTLW